MAKKKNIWRGSFYQRKSGTWRQRNTGYIVNNVGLKTRQNHTNLSVVSRTAKNYRGVEPRRMNFYGYDPRKVPSAEKKFIIPIRANRSTARKKRKAHQRNIS